MGSLEGCIILRAGVGGERLETAETSAAELLHLPHEL